MVTSESNPIPRAQSRQDVQMLAGQVLNGQLAGFVIEGLTPSAAESGRLRRPQKGAEAASYVLGAACRVVVPGAELLVGPTDVDSLRTSPFVGLGTHHLQVTRGLRQTVAQDTGSFTERGVIVTLGIDSFSAETNVALGTVSPQTIEAARTRPGGAGGSTRSLTQFVASSIGRGDKEGGFDLNSNGICTPASVRQGTVPAGHSLIYTLTDHAYAPRPTMVVVGFERPVTRYRAPMPILPPRA